MLEARDVTGVTLDLDVLSNELPTAVAGVVEVRRLPFLIAVAVGAVGSQPARMRILGLVATEAGLGDLVFQIARAVTIRALQIHMDALQRESGLLEVIELGGLPTGGGVAIRALGPALPAVYVIG